MPDPNRVEPEPKDFVVLLLEPNPPVPKPVPVVEFVAPPPKRPPAAGVVVVAPKAGLGCPKPVLEAAPNPV